MEKIFEIQFSNLLASKSVGIALGKQMIWNFQCHLSSPSDEVKIYTVPANAN